MKIVKATKQGGSLLLALTEFIEKDVEYLVDKKDDVITIIPVKSALKEGK